MSSRRSRQGVDAWALQHPPLLRPGWRPTLQSSRDTVDRSPPRARPQAKGSAPRDGPLQTPITRPTVACAPDQPARNGEPTPLLKVNNSPEWLTELRGTRSPVHYITKDVMKGTGEQQPSRGRGKGQAPRRTSSCSQTQTLPAPELGDLVGVGMMDQ